MATYDATDFDRNGATIAGGIHILQAAIHSNHVGILLSGRGIMTNRTTSYEPGSGVRALPTTGQLWPLPPL